MTAATMREADGTQSILEEFRLRIRRERRCVTDERQAFDTFLNRVKTVEPRSCEISSVRRPVRFERTPGLEKVREEYETTVMDVPHYSEEYGDTYAESVAAEFGPEVGYLLVEGDRFEQRLKRAVLDKACQCRSERDRLLRTLDIEADSIDAVENRCRPIDEELDTFDSERLSEQSYGGLEAEWKRLDVLSKKVDQMVTDRQRAIMRQRNELGASIDTPDVPTYLYQEFDERYPLLSMLVGLQKRIREYQDERVCALSGA